MLFLFTHTYFDHRS